MAIIFLWYVVGSILHGNSSKCLLYTLEVFGLNSGATETKFLTCTNHAAPAKEPDNFTKIKTKGLPDVLVLLIRT